MKETTRFGGIQRLYGTEGLERLQSAHVCVVGIGGVGSWSVEALARSGIGRLTLVDMDDVCVSNVNRQLHALDGQIGHPKVEVMAERAKLINPAAELFPIVDFFNEETAAAIFQTPFTYVLDAIDHLANKCLLIATAHRRNIPVFVIGSAGGRRSPLNLQVTDLGLSSHDRLLSEVRRMLRSQYGFPTEPRTIFGVDCVYSKEPALYPQPDGTVCATRASGTSVRLDCDSGYGTATFVTGTFGFVAAAEIVKKIALTQA
ncbi:MAG: tRNA threonylcarbamoyladenosine dehydratase [Verrucomicrobiota bacterium]|nr:tRNA threonylcarbamoyladenosine dehydratase [Verrucomicrobiota bacterium]